jgi:hypothetical protein
MEKTERKAISLVFKKIKQKHTCVAFLTNQVRSKTRKASFKENKIKQRHLFCFRNKTNIKRTVKLHLYIGLFLT